MKKMYQELLTAINQQEKGFSLNDIEETLAPARKKNSSKSNKPAASRGSSKVKDLLQDLVKLGYLHEKENIYHHSPKKEFKKILNVTRRGYGQIEIDDSLPLIIIESEHLASAQHGDEVNIEIFDYNPVEDIYLGRVTRLYYRKQHHYMGRLVKVTKEYLLYSLTDIPGSSMVAAKPVENLLRVGSFATLRFNGHVLNELPEVRILDQFEGDDPALDFERICCKYNLPAEHKKYAELDNVQSIMEAELAANRKDYRHLFTITIDGEDAKDFDDAISLECSNNQYHLYVHIADVSAFVTPGSSIDRAAYHRGTSYYLGNRVIPMIPEELSNDLCSLKADTDRLTLSAEIIFNENGIVENYHFHKGIIRVDKRLTYNLAEEIINTQNPPELASSLLKMRELSRKLKANRMLAGRVDLELSDQKIVYKDKIPVDLQTVNRLESHKIVEEFMLSANEVVANHLNKLAIPALHRVHEPISEEKLELLKQFLASLGKTINPDVNLGVALQEIIDSVSGLDYHEVVNFIILRSMMQAYYSPEALGHFGLGFTDYTHFTSPIRRYPDLIVHRVLKSWIDQSGVLYSTPELVTIGEKSSEMERIAQSAERDLYKMTACRLMKEHIGETFTAIISGVGKSGFFVSLQDKPIEGMVPLKALTDDYYLIMEDEYTVIGKRLKKRYRLGDHLNVKLVDVDELLLRIDFTVA